MLTGGIHLDSDDIRCALPCVGLADLVARASRATMMTSWPSEDLDVAVADIEAVRRRAAPSFRCEIIYSA